MRRVIVCGATVSRTLLTTPLRIRGSATCFMSRSTHASTTPINQISSMQSSASDTNSSPQHTLPSTTRDEGSSVSSAVHPLHTDTWFPYDLFAYVGQPLSTLYTDYPDTPQFIFTGTAATPAHQLIWIRVPSKGEAAREKMRELEREKLKSGQWQRPYAHLIAGGRDINSVSGKPMKCTNSNIVLNFDKPVRVSCYHVVLTSKLTYPNFREPKDWEIQSVFGFIEMPSDDEISHEMTGYLRALG